MCRRHKQRYKYLSVTAPRETPPSTANTNICWRKIEEKVAYRLNKLKFLLLLHFLYLENILQGGVIKQLSLLVNLRVGLRVRKQKLG